jgi:hypothetical protein
LHTARLFTYEKEPATATTTADGIYQQQIHAGFKPGRSMNVFMLATSAKQQCTHRMSLPLQLCAACCAAPSMSMIFIPLLQVHTSNVLRRVPAAGHMGLMYFHTAVPAVPHLR